ncbi:MAG: hypothetical protein NVSMB19_20360 [Vulcanimicrobiaceae bacterium]
MERVPRPRRASLFGTRLRDRLLCLLSVVPEIHVRGAAAVLDAPPSETAKAVASLERLGVIATHRQIGPRLVSLDPRWYAAAELRPLLSRMIAADSELTDRVAALRSRPRGSGKASR